MIQVYRPKSSKGKWQAFLTGTFMESIHPGRLTWNLQITHLERKMIFQTSMIIFHVDLPGCTSLHTEHQEIELVHQSTLPGTLAVENHRILNLAW